MLCWFYLNDLSSRLKCCWNKRQFKGMPRSTCLNSSERRALDMNGWSPRFNTYWGNIFTARIRRMRKVIVSLCLSIHTRGAYPGWGGYLLWPGPDGGICPGWGGGGTYLGQVQMGGGTYTGQGGIYLGQVQTVVPTKVLQSRYLLAKVGTPQPGQDGGYPKVGTPRPR